MKAYPRHNINLGKETFWALLKVIIKGQILRGPHIDKFEREFASYIGTKYAIGVGSGRMGLYLILKAMEFNRGDEIILPSYNFYAVPAMVILCNLRPVFVDINRETCNIDVNLIEEKITPRTKAIIATHIYGQPCEIESILDIAKRHNLKVIEDCVQTCGAEYKKRKVGSFGDASSFSLAMSKNIPCFGGGMITTNDAILFKKIKALIEDYRYPNWMKLLRDVVFGSLAYLGLRPKIFPWTIYPAIKLADLFGLGIMHRAMEEKITLFSHLPAQYKLRLANLQAAVGLTQLPRLDKVIQSIRNNAEFLTEQLRNVSNIKIPKIIPEVKSSYLYYRIEVEDRAKVIKRLLRCGIDTQREYLSACSNLSIFSDFSADCPVSEEVCVKSLEIPNNQYLKKEDLLYIANTIRQACKTNDQ